jgi:hypothetical protein
MISGALALLICIAILGVALTWWSTAEASNDQMRGIRSITPRGWKILACGFFLLVLSIWQYALSESEKTELASQELARDSVQARMFVELLAQYHLKYDSGQKQVLAMVRDSARRTTIIRQQQADPSLTMCPETGLAISGSHGRNLSVSYCILCREATAHSLDIKHVILVNDTVRNRWVVSGPHQVATVGATLPMDAKYTGGFTFSKGNTDSTHFNEVYNYLYGTYSNRAGKKFAFAEFWGIDLKTKNAFIPAEPRFRDIVKEAQLEKKIGRKIL